MHFAGTAKTIIPLCNKDLKMFGLETNFESTRPISHHIETKAKIIRPVSRPTSLIVTALTAGTGMSFLIRKYSEASVFYVKTVKIRWRLGAPPPDSLASGS